MKTDEQVFCVCFVKIRYFKLHGNNLIHDGKLAQMGQLFDFPGGV